MWIRTCFFTLPLDAVLLDAHPYKVFQGKSHRRRRGSAFSMRVRKYWNKLPASVATAPFVNIFKKGWRKFGEKSFPISPNNTPIY